MLDFATFKKEIDLKRKLDKGIDDLEKILDIYIFESSLVSIAYSIFDAFIESHFTEAGADLVFWWLYEDVPKRIYTNNITTEVEDIEDLWDYMNTDPKTYFK